MRIEDKAKIGTAWVTIGQVNLKVLSLITLVILARLLTPEDFGLAVMATVIIEFMRLFGDFGISAAIVHHQKDVDRYANASFWMNLILAIILTLATIILAPITASFYQREMVKNLMYIFSISFVFQGIGVTHYTLLTKNLDFKKATIVKLVSDTLMKLTTIFMAFSGYGVWSLIVPEVVIAPLKSLLYWVVCPWRPKWHLDLPYMKKIFDYGKHVFGTDLVRFINVNTDYLIIGRVLGDTLLGYYSFAYNNAHWPVVNIVWIVSIVTFPLFSKLQNNLQRLREVFLKMTRILSIITFPLFVGLFVTAPEFIPFVFGDKWKPAILAFQILLISAARRSFTSLSGQILKAVGHPEKEFYLNLVLAPCLILGILIGVKYGIIGISIATVVIMGVAGLFFLHVALKEIQLRLTEVFKNLVPALTSSLLMASGVAIIRFFLLPLNIGRPLLILCYLISGVFLYGSFIFLLFKNNFTEIWELMRSMLPQRRSKAASDISA